ncbi:uncharacterized protein LOC18010886 [Eutrema salsugineum]|uniref:uncharacterized protein LOC18010886 n=1 Tax=Eutrema salsugineum TaxID=72664 RepID=UPI000CED0072|nr:uncharacterized protein LOC18010886 [Eutrema salsugineum]
MREREVDLAAKNSSFEPCFTTSFDGSEAMLPLQDRSATSPPDLKVLSFSVSFNGWRRACPNFKSWARKMSALHKPTWEKAGIFEAVMASTLSIHKNTDLILGIAEKWCPETNTFVFPWGEATITLEDVMVLLGFSVLGSPYFAALDSSGEMIRRKLAREARKFKEDKKVQFITQVLWTVRFMDSGDELEHVAFLSLWLSYFVFPSRYYHLTGRDIFSVAVHLSRGTKIALAPAVLAHLYGELSLLKNHIRDFTLATITHKIELSSLFKLVQVWTWERFRELQPKRNMILEGEPRMARWVYPKRQETSHVREILKKSKMDSFEWRPYTKAVENWKFPQFYPEKAMWVPVGPNLDDEFISFARCIKVFKLVGIHCVEHYFPNRVASQFGLFQDVPCPVIRNNLSREAAWDEYNKPIDVLTLYIPSRSAKPRFTPEFCEWWKKSSLELQYFPKENRVVESAETLTLRNIGGDDDTSDYVPSSSKRQEHLKSSLELQYYQKENRVEHLKRVRENDESTMGRCHTKVPSDNDEEDDSLTIGQVMRLKKKKYREKSGGDASESHGKKRRLEADSNDSWICQKLQKSEDETVAPREMEQRSEEDDEEEETGSKGGKNTVLIQANVNNPSDPLLGPNGGGVELVVSPPETRQNYDDEVDVNGINAEKKKIVVDDGTKEAESLLHEDGEKQRSNEKEDDDDERLKQRTLAIYEIASNLEARIMKVENTFAKIRKWKTRRNQATNGVSA